MKLYFISSKWTATCAALLAAGVAVNQATAQHGAFMSGSGPVNRSMGGAATAAPLGASGAMFWNPASIAGFSRSEIEVGADLIFPHSDLSSSLPAGVFGGGFPPITLAGTTNNDRGAYPMPTIALAYLPEDSRFTFGLGMFAVAGFGVDYAGSSTNPLLTPPPFGVGPLASDYQVLQISPTVGYRLSDRLSVAFGPTLDMAVLRLDPALFATPNAIGTYPPGTHAQTTWGGGFVGGLYYKADTFGFGASFKSPQWFDDFRYNSHDELGQARELRASLNLPMIISVGAAYTGWERWVFAADVRWLDYATVNGFGDAGYKPTGAFAGLGWRSIFAVALGAQYQLTDAISLRGGYTWNENPIPDSHSLFNVGSPLIIEHQLSAGASYKVTDDLALSVAYSRCFENSIAGPLVTPFGAVPGTTVSSSASADIIMFGATLRFGGCRRCGDCTQPLVSASSTVYEDRAIQNMLPRDTVVLPAISGPTQGN